MPDVFTKKKRSEIMSKIRSVSGLEKAFAKSLSEAIYPKGIRYRLNYKKAPGRPDIAFISRKLAIFIDGDFWHGFRYPLWRGRLNTGFWYKKIERNRERDKICHRKLRHMGWKVMRVWEHQLSRDFDRTINKIAAFLK